MIVEDQLLTQNEESKCFLPPSKLVINNHIQILLSTKNLKTLVLDLDETLVHSQFEPSEKASYIVEIEYQDEIKTIYVIERPGVHQFLSTMTNYFEVVLFTSGQQTYAEKVIEQLDPHNQQHCINQELWYVKDLAKLGRDLNDVIIVDNSYECFSLQPENGFLISSFFDDLEDDELLENIDFFIQLSELQDVRDVEYWKEQYDSVIKNEDQIESLNEIKEDSNENVSTPICSQLSYMIPAENGDKMQEADQDTVIESKKRLSQDIKPKQIQNFNVNTEINLEEINDNSKQIYRRKKASKTVFMPNKKKCEAEIQHEEQNTLYNKQKFGNYQYGTLQQIYLHNEFKEKTCAHIEEAGFQRIKNRILTSLNIKVDNQRFDKNNLMSPLIKNQEYYSKHSQLFLN